MDTALKENIAAISAILHRHDRYAELYEKRGRQLGGFPGIWDYAIDMAEAFTEAEPEEWDGEWVTAVEDFVEIVVHDLIEYGHAELPAIAQRAVEFTQEHANVENR